MTMSHGRVKLVLLSFFRKTFWFTDQLVNLDMMAYMYLRVYTNGDFNLRVIRICINMKEEITIPWGIVMDIRITFDIEKRRHVRCLQVFSLIFQLRYDKEKQSYTKYTSGILIDIRITFDKEKQGCV